MGISNIWERERGEEEEKKMTDTRMWEKNKNEYTYISEKESEMMLESNEHMYEISSYLYTKNEEKVFSLVKTKVILNNNDDEKKEDCAFELIKYYLQIYFQLESLAFFFFFLLYSFFFPLEQLPLTQFMWVLHKYRR